MKFFERKIYKHLKSHLRERQITVLTGMRRVGKTTLIARLLDEIESKNKIYIDLQRVDNRQLFGEKNYDNIVLELAKRGLEVSKKMYLAIDEIQLVSEIPGVIKYLYDHYDIKFIITGSSSYYMKNLFSESLAGRKKIFELYPLDFGEFLIFKQVKAVGSDDFLKTKFDEYEYQRLKNYYDEYIEFGGFPEVALADSPEIKKDLLNDIISSYINIDVESLADFKKRDDFYNVVKILASRIGSRLDYAKLSSIAGINVITLRNYIGFLEDTYLIKRVPVFTRNADREIAKAQKLYFIDSGLANVLADLDAGAKFENAVLNQLARQGQVRYYALKGGQEIDFIFKNKFALEAKETPAESDQSDLIRLAKIAGLNGFRLVGKNISPKFKDYIWGGSIR
jgi:predicted AAA+ superfamily ATPase